MRFAMRAAAAAAILTLALFSTALPAGEPVLWVEDSFEDFADGQLDAAGQNLYVSRDGALRTIHRFDLNRDGHLDLIFNSTHDNFTYIPATLGLMEPSRRIRRAELAVEGSLGVVLEDLTGMATWTPSSAPTAAASRTPGDCSPFCGEPRTAGPIGEVMANCRSMAPWP